MFTGTNIAPRLCAAIIDSNISMPLCSIAMTQSPGPTPISAKADASRFVCASNA